MKPRDLFWLLTLMVGTTLAAVLVIFGSLTLLLCLMKGIEYLL